MHNTEIEIVTDRTEKDKDAFPNPEFLEHYRTKTESPRQDLSSHDNLRGGGDVCHLPGQLIEIIWTWWVYRKTDKACGSGSVFTNTSCRCS